MRSDPAELLTRIGAIEEALRQLGQWDTPPLSAPEDASVVPFGHRRVAFARWLRWKFLPGIRHRMADGGPWPEESHLGAYARAAFGGKPEMQRLVRALQEFDEVYANLELSAGRS